MTSVVDRTRADVLSPSAAEVAQWEAQDRAVSSRSIAQSKARIAAAFSVACAEHDAEAGESCWTILRGVCAPRYVEGIALTSGRPLPLRPGELGPLATATRYASRRHGRTYGPGARR